jgi:predicted MFS family arabinose efflux permease
VLWPLMFGNIVIGTGVMMATGVLTEVSTSLDVSIATAGQLISSSALFTCVGAPLFAAWVSGWDRKKLLTASLLWYSVLHALAAVSDTFSALLSWRALAMAGAAIFTPQAASCIGLLVPAAQRGRAITFIFLGWSVASVIGTPLGAWLGGTFGWRYAFGLISILSLVSAAWLWRSLPAGIRPPALSRSAWVTTLTSRTLMLTVSVTMVSAAGQFVLFSYMAPYLKDLMGASTTSLSVLLLLYGVFGFMGNAFVARHIDRIGPSRSVMVSLTLMACGLALWPLGHSTLWLALAFIPWGLGGFSANSAQQARLLQLAPNLASASIALNSSAIYAGQAIGAGLGGWLLMHQGLSALPGYALLGVLLAMGVSWQASRYAQSHPLPQPAGVHG